MRESLRRFLSSLFRFQGSPHRLALSFAVGVMLGVIPGTGAFVAAGAATLFKLNLPLAVAGALLTNPVTTPLIYGASYAIGRWLLGNWLPDDRLSRIVVGTLTGNLTLSLTLSVISYVILRLFICWVRARRLARHAARD